MPELADVEGFRRVLARHAVGRRVLDVNVIDSGVLRGFTPDTLRDALRGNSFAEPDRHGKLLISPIRETGAHLLIHFGMTGALVWSDGDRQRHRHERVSIAVTTGELRYRDMRKLKGLYLVPDRHELENQLAALGPDACAISAQELREAVCRRRRMLKSALSDQRTIAGLGNLLVDEILWQTELDPRDRGVDISGRELERLHSTMRTVLCDAAAAGRVPARNSWLTGHRDVPSGQCPDGTDPWAGQQSHDSVVSAVSAAVHAVTIGP